MALHVNAISTEAPKAVASRGYVVASLGGLMLTMTDAEAADLVAAIWPVLTEGDTASGTTE